MRTLKKEHRDRYASELARCGNIAASGSVLGMQRQYGWPKKGQVRVGSYVYNVGPEVVERMINRGHVSG